MKQIFLMILAGLFVVGCSSARVAGGPEIEYPVLAEAEVKYQSAEKCFADKEYRSALKLLKDGLALTKNLGQREKISFLTGECLFSLDYYNDAHKWFRQFLLDFPRTERLNDVVRRELEIGFKFIKGAKRSLWGLYIIPSYDLGVSIVRETLKSYPYSEHSEPYAFKLAGHLFESGYYEEALDEYAGFISVYPKSALAPEAEYQKACCYAGIYQGYAYDATPLSEAYKITSKFQARYPESRVGGAVSKLHDEIVDMMVRRDYETAMFYIRTDKPKSAVIYLEGLIKDYPETSWAKDAAVALSGLRAN